MTHRITLEELAAWMDAEAWHLAASSCGRGSRKSLEMSNDKMFRVTDRGEVVYSGSSPLSAVEAYNAAP